MDPEDTKWFSSVIINHIDTCDFISSENRVTFTYTYPVVDVLKISPLPYNGRV
ncbi:hypothetical protein SAMN06269173_11451 [Hymenobacter mucosus]|uniref:Uncharacterized protein n=1 Tax=Hymenobacter mucosus TaxID=1411120 RepID=A0A239AQH5_9BACT|nr:hypothetical protein SAMN06269173_11451 [Hymenobacter mucosus]